MIASAETEQTLESLTREHSYAFDFCTRIREGLNRNVETGRIRKYIDWFEKNYLVPHFEFEEQYVFPVLGNNARVKKALANHRRIRRLLSCSCTDEKVLTLLEEELATYIRFEERTLYNEIKPVAGAEKLAEIKRHHDKFEFSDGWKDRFWIG